MVVLSRVADPPVMKAAPPPIPSLEGIVGGSRRAGEGQADESDRRAGAPGARGGGTTVARARGRGAVGLVARDEVGGLGLFGFLRGPELRIDGEGSGRQIGEAAADANAAFAGVAAVTAGGLAAGAARGAGVERQPVPPPVPPVPLPPAPPAPPTPPVRLVAFEFRLTIRLIRGDVDCHPIEGGIPGIEHATPVGISTRCRRFHRFRPGRCRRCRRTGCRRP